jgi:hypothetical protein
MELCKNETELSEAATLNLDSDNCDLLLQTGTADAQKQRQFHSVKLIIEHVEFLGSQIETQIQVVADGSIVLPDEITTVRLNELRPWETDVSAAEKGLSRINVVPTSKTMKRSFFGRMAGCG